MILASNLETSNRTELLTLEVPVSQIHETEYYIWTDYMYALEDPEGFEEQSGITIEELENQLKHPGETELCQVVIDKKRLLFGIFSQIEVFLLTYLFSWIFFICIF